MRILVVDDSEDARDLTEGALHSAGYEDVIAVPSAWDAIRLLDVGRTTDDEPSVDIVLLDIVMPEMDGIELARRAAELDPHLKIMFITGFAAVALHPDSKAPKDAKVLSKPFHLRDLVAEVDRMMAA